MAAELPTESAGRPSAEGAAPAGAQPPAAALETGPAVLPEVADGVERRLDPRWVSLRRTTGWIFAAVAGLGPLVPVGSMVLFAPFPGWLDALLLLNWAGLALFLVWNAWRWPAIEHRHASYRVDRQGIRIRRGVFWQKEIDVPRARVQHTDVSQGPLERGLGLGTLVVYTAGTAHAKVELPGLDHGLALAIRDHLLPGVGEDAL